MRPVVVSLSGMFVVPFEARAKTLPFVRVSSDLRRGDPEDTEHFICVKVKKQLVLVEKKRSPVRGL